MQPYKPDAASARTIQRNALNVTRSSQLRCGDCSFIRLSWVYDLEINQHTTA